MNERLTQNMVYEQWMLGNVICCQMTLSLGKTTK